MKIAVVDSGYTCHPPNRRVQEGVSVVPAVDAPRGWGVAGNTSDHLRHGTAVTEIILDSDPGARVIPVKIFHGNLRATVAQLIGAIDTAVAEGVQVINVSAGTILLDAIRPLYAACERARRQGVIVVAAGGPDEGPSIPAGFDNVIGVAAGAFADVHSYEYRANHGLECVAHGEHLAQDEGGLRSLRMVGTSFAAPRISVRVAQLLTGEPAHSLESIRRQLELLAYVCS